MTINFDNYMKEHVVYYNPEYVIDDIFSKLYNEEWDIIAYRDNIIIKKNKKIPMIYKDIIINVKSDDALLYYVIDDILYPIRDDTRLIPTLTPFKTIYLIAFGEKKRNKVTFTRLLMKDKIINDLRKKIVFDSNFTYINGELI